MASDHGTIDVVAAVITRESRVLIGRRPSHKRHGGYWEFPGGKVHQGETLEAALSREIVEELGVKATAISPPCYTAADPGSPGQVHFMPARIVGEPVLREHEALRWCSVNSLAGLPLAPSDAEFAAIGLHLA